MAVAPPANLLGEKDDLMLPVSPTLAIYIMVLRRRSDAEVFAMKSNRSQITMPLYIAVWPALRKNFVLETHIHLSLRASSLCRPSGRHP